MPVRQQVDLLALSGSECLCSMIANVRALTQARAGFYAENLLLYAPQAKEEGILPLPIGENHKFAPVVLGVGVQ